MARKTGSAAVNFNSRKIREQIAKLACISPLCEPCGFQEKRVPAAFKVLPPGSPYPGKSKLIGTKVTLRGETAETFLKTSLEILERVLFASQFDRNGNVSFGIEEHTDYPGMAYDPKIGIYGMDINVVLERPGVRIARRREQQKKLPNHQRVTKDDAIAFMTEAFGVEVR